MTRWDKIIFGLAHVTGGASLVVPAVLFVAAGVVLYRPIRVYKVNGRHGGEV